MLRRYEVVAGCYVPVGSGLKFKKPGQVVSLDDIDAAGLGGYVKPVGVAKRNTKSKVKPDLRTESEREADYQADLSRKDVTWPTEEPEEVTSDAG